MGLTNLIQKFKQKLSGKESDKNEFQSVINEFRSDENRFQSEQIPYDAEIELIEMRIEALENQRKLISEEIENKSHSKLIDVVAEVFHQSTKALKAEEVLERMDKSKVKGKNTNLPSVRATLHYLVKKKVLKRGKQRGSFKLKKTSHNRGQ